MVANIVGRISCVDLEASSLEMDPDDPERIEFINSLALDQNRIADGKLFRLHEKPQVIVVSPGLKDLIVAQSITGIRFYAPADFTM